MCIRDSSSPMETLCQVLLKVAQWFWRKRWKCEKFTNRQMDRDIQTDRQTDRRQTTGDQKSSLELSALMLCAKIIRKLASVVPVKNVTEIILWPNLPMSTGDTINGGVTKHQAGKMCFDNISLLDILYKFKRNITGQFFNKRNAETSLKLDFYNIIQDKHI